MNNFYNQPILFQWIKSILLLIVGILPALAVIEIGYSNSLYYLLFIIYVPIAQFSFTPFYKLVGVYRYYSPMLLGYMANDQQIDLHSGASFDYLFVMRKYKTGIEFRNRLLLYYLEGILKIIQLIENNNIPKSVNIVGTSYFINERTINKMGFQSVKPSLFYRLNLFINIIDLIWMNSFSQGKFSIPKLWNVKKATISGAKLIENKNLIENIYVNLKSRMKKEIDKNYYY